MSKKRSKPVAPPANAKGAATRIIDALPADPNVAMQALGLVLTHLILCYSSNPENDAYNFMAHFLSDVRASL